jgi:predicted nuclease of predicted toxin-antitoxin system
MKFLVDAQLPRRLARRLRGAGHEAIHTLDLPQGNRTPDTDIIALAAHDDYVVATKDADFVNSFILKREPRKLLLISTGNISNADLEILLERNLGKIVQAFLECDFVELTRDRLIDHT